MSKSRFSFLSEATDVPMKTADLAKGHGGYIISTYRLKIQPILTAC
jgi:hypothetical protein